MFPEEDTSSTIQKITTKDDMILADAVLNVAATLRGSSDALAYRAEAEDDDMLALMADVIYNQAATLQSFFQ